MKVTVREYVILKIFLALIPVIFFGKGYSQQDTSFRGVLGVDTLGEITVTGEKKHYATGTR